MLSPSMGPRLVGRGKMQYRMAKQEMELPSMGPRLVGRGKLEELLKQDLDKDGLQWGRVLWDAERQ